MAAKHFGHAQDEWFYGCDGCNPVKLHLTPLIEPPSQEELEAVIYQARWIDGIKDGALCSDEAIAKAVLKKMKEKEKNKKG